MLNRDSTPDTNKFKPSRQYILQVCLLYTTLNTNGETRDEP